jgi:hypothetical protein
MSDSTTGPAIGEVRSAAQVLQDDVMCQSFIQGSSTLAYACLLIRRGQYELAAHVLKVLDAGKVGRYREIVFYLQGQIDIESGLFDAVKARFVARLQEQPADAVALSLLQACIQAELTIFPGMSEAKPKVELQPPSRVQNEKSMVAPPIPKVVVADEPAANPPPRPAKSHRDINASAIVDLMLFQSVIQDAGTKAFAVWDGYSRDIRRDVRDASLDTLVSDLPALLPGGLAAPIAGLDAGKTVKTCFSFSKITVTTLHQGDLNCGLITGPLNQSLIAMVRTETLFSKRANQIAAQSGERNGAG